LSKEEEPKKVTKRLEDWEPIHDSIGVTHWLPPRRCVNCDD
jgi:hypothetical protein